MKISRLSLISLVLSIAIFSIAVVLLRTSLQGGSSLTRLSKAARDADSLRVKFLNNEEREFFDLSESEFNEFKKLFEDHYLTTEVQTMCHDPGQVLQFRKGGSTLLTGTLCLKCVNFEVTGIVFGSPTVTIMDGRADDPMTLPRIQQFFDETRDRKTIRR